MKIQKNQKAQISPLLCSPLLSFLYVFLFVSCSYSELKDIPNRSLGNEKVEGLDFEALNSQVFEPHCKRCHSDWSGNYQLTLSRLGDIESLVKINKMPKQAPALSDEKKALLFSWIASGAPETVVGKPPTDEPTPPVEPPVDPLPGDIDFAYIYNQVLEPKCLKCHAWLSNYESVALGINEIRSEVALDRMPIIKTPSDTLLTPKQKTLLLNWIDSGFPEFKEQPSPPLPVNWDMISSRVIQPYCLKCHSEFSEKNEWVRLVTYEDVFPIRLSVKRAVENDKMPKNSALPSELKVLLLNWIEKGLPRN